MEVKRGMWFKTLATFLAFVMFVTSVPITVLANLDEDFSEKEIQRTINDSISEKEYSETIATEITGERDEHSKTFLMDDGSYYSFVSNNSIHTYSDNEWIDVYSELNTSYETVETVEEAMSNISTYDTLESFQGTSYLDYDYKVEDSSITCASTDAVEENDVFDIDMLEISNSYLFVKPNFVDTYSSENKVVTKAICNFSISSVYDKSNLSIYEETYDWENNINEQGLVTFSNNTKNLLLDKEEISISTSSEDTIDLSIDITNSFIKWERNILENNGICIKIQSENGEIYISNISFSIRYINADSDNTNYTYHTLDLGKAGTISINDITNTFSVTQNIIGIDSFVMPVSISRYISSVSPTLESTGNVGGNWNYGKSLTYNGNIMIWTTPDSSSVRFVKTDDINNGYIKWEQITDNVAAFATLYVKTDTNLEIDNTDYSNCYIEDSDYTYRFNSSGKLISISNGMYEVILKYGEYGLTSIIDTNGNTFKFTYGTYKIRTTTYRYVKEISAYSSDNNIIPKLNVDISVLYNSETKKITSTTKFSDNTTVSYVFDSYGFLQQIICEDNSVVNFTYKNEDNPYITAYEHKSDNTVLESLSINSDYTYYRVFTDKNNNFEHYYYNTRYQLTTYKDTGSNNLSCITYDENGYVYAYATLEKESILKNHDFSDNPIVDNSWDISNKLFYTYDETNLPHLSLSPSEASINFTQSYTGNDSSELKKGDTIVFGIKGVLNNTYPVSNDDHNIGVAINVTYSDRTTESYSLEFDSSLLNTEQVLLKAVELNKDCRKISYSISVKNQEGSLNVEDAILFIADESEVVPFGIKTSEVYNSEYDNDGRITQKSISYDNNSLIQSYQYDENNNLISLTDENGVTTYFEYDSATNKLIQSGSVLDSSGNIKNPTEYVYNANNLLESVEATVTSINNVGDSTSTISLGSLYDYDSSNRITSVTNNGTTYSFNYLPNGNIDSISVSGQNENNETVEQKLQQYEYDSNSNINKIVYANGSEISYSYSDNGKVDTITYYNTKDSQKIALLKFNYTYDNSGDVSSVICNTADVILGENKTTKNKIVYTDRGYELYDYVNTDGNETERLIYSTNCSAEDDLTSREESYFANADEGFFESAETSNSVVKTNNKTTDIMNFSMEKSFLVSSTYKIDYNMQSVIEKDSFGRIISNTIDRSFVNRTQPENSANLNYTTSYSYETLDLGNGQTSSLLSEYKINGDLIENSSLLDAIASTVFKYDSRGNLQFKYYKIEESSQEECYYVLGNYYGYDEQNQLICEANPIEDKYATYTYDESGNLCTKRIFNTVTNFEISDNPDLSVYELIAMDCKTFDEFDFNKLKNSLLLIDSDEYYEYTYTFDNVFKDRMIRYTEKSYSKNNDIIESEIIVDETINYDECGNPLNYIGYNYEGLVRANLKWCGNLLTEFDMLDDDSNVIKIFTYEYDQNGYRTSKKKYLNNADGSFDLHSEQNYIWDNGILQGVIFKGEIYDYLTENSSYNENLVTSSKIIYDSEGSPIGYVTPTGFMYQYIKDAQGNVIGLQVTGNDDDLVYIEMSYDSWGQLTFNNTPDPNKLGYNSFMLTALFNPCTYKGYLYDYESGMYYAKNECYSPTWARNISTDGDYSSLMRASSNPLDSNPYLFCNNNLINNTDTYASWSTIKNDFNLFDNGFSIGMSKAFLSRPFCTLYASQIIKENGSWNYQYGNNLYNMDVERISSNLFARALGHYSPNAINKVNANWGLGWLTNDTYSDNSIYVKNNEDDHIVRNYRNIWRAAPSIKNYAWSSGIFITV